ncbi:hypothetical protein [Pacificoceanicola onchidii]|nr:hypothetical protein [Pacificoceanicola onchidii]
MKTITILQALALVVLAVYGASAGVGGAAPCVGMSPASEACEL